MVSLTQPRCGPFWCLSSVPHSSALLSVVWGTRTQEVASQRYSEWDISWRTLLLSGREGESNHQQRPSQRPFSGFHESQPRAGGVGKFVATQRVKIWNPQWLQKGPESTKGLGCRSRRISLQKSHANKTALLLIYCSLNENTKQLSFCEQDDHTAVPPFLVWS